MQDFNSFIMDKVLKALNKLVPKEKKQVKNIIKALQSGRFDNMDIKKLRGEGDIFRVRKGSIRVIYQMRNNQMFVLKIGHRKEATYKL